jgi:hypothetical protein
MGVLSNVGLVTVPIFQERSLGEETTIVWSSPVISYRCF